MDDNETDYFGFSFRFCLIVIGFLTDFDLFYQIRYGFGMSLSIVTFIPP